MNKELTKISKYLSFILRHQPESIGLELDSQGWGLVSDLIAKTSAFSLDRALLEILVQTNDKQRFAFNAEGTHIRANQGHSIQVDMALPPLEPPEILLHGTAARFLKSIQEQGLIKGKRHHVHLSTSASVARAVGQRYGKPVLLEVQALKMHQEGHLFFKTANGVWLVEAVPPQYLREQID